MNGKTVGVILYEELMELKINHGKPKIIFLAHMSILRQLYAAVKSGFALTIRKYFQRNSQASQVRKCSRSIHFWNPKF